MKTLHTQTWIVALGIGAALFAGCAGKIEPPAEKPVLCRVERRDIVDTCSENGILEALRVYSFYPEVGNNKLVALHVREGDRVHKGDVLFEFDKTPVEAEKKILQAKLQAAETRLTLLRERRTGIETVEARQRLVQMQQAEKDAASALAVKQEMAELGLAAASEQEQLEARLRAGKLGAELAALQLDELEQHATSPEIADIEAEILQHRNAMRQLEEREKDFASTAPFDGRIVRINDDVRNLSALAADVDLFFRQGHGPLIILADTDSMRVMTRFFERDVARIRVGQPARVTSKHVPDKVFEGAVTAVGELGDTLGETTTVAVEVEVRNEDNLLKPGLKAETRVVVAEEKDVLAIPVEFIRSTDDELFVWRSTAGGAPEKTAVVTGISDGRYTEVKSGLAEGDILVME